MTPTAGATAGDRKRERIDPLIAEPQDRWDLFLAGTENGTIFHAAWWYRAWEIEPEVRVLEGDGGRIQAGICYARGRKWGGSAILRPPLSPRNGPAYLPSGRQGRPARYSHAKQMVQAVLPLLPRVSVYDLILSPGDIDIQPYLWNGFDALVAYTYVIPKEDAGAWREGASEKQRRNLRKAHEEASASGYTLVVDPPFEEVRPVLAETPALKGYSISRHFAVMPRWWEAVRARDAGRSYLLRDREGRGACAALMVWDHRSAYYLAGGMRGDLRKTARSNLLLFERMIDDAHERGLDFDFEGSTVPGVEYFFRRLGGELRPFYRVIKIPSPLVFSLWQAHRFLTRHRRRRWVRHD
jgi:hypothetical protein